MDRWTGSAGRVMVAWIACNLLGWLAAAGLVLVLRTPGSPLGMPWSLILVLVPPAVAQWLLLRRLLGLTPWWLVTIPLGCLAFAGLVAAIPSGLWQVVDDEGIGTLSILSAILGALIGLGQWLILRRRVSGAEIWVAASAAGIGLGFAAVLSTGLLDRSGFAAYAVVVLTYAMLSGAALAWMLARPAPMRAVAAA